MSNEFYFQSSDGHTMIYAKKWFPATTPIGIIHIIHGMAEHVNRYNELAHHLTNRGWIVVGDDHLGHGHSVNNLHHLGFFGTDHPVDHLLQDEITLLTTIQADYPSLPYVVLGHSMGSMMAQCLLPHISNRINGCILTGTTASHPELGPVWPLVTALNKFASRRVGYLFDRLAFGGFSKRFNRHVKFSWLTHSLPITEQYYADPLSGFIFTNNGFYTLFSLTKQATTNHWFRGIRTNLPILFASGTHDPVGKFGKGPRHFFNQLTSNHYSAITLQLFTGMRHEILNEDNRIMVYEFIDRWLAKNVKII